MITTLVDYIKNKNAIITASPDVGSTTTSLAIAEKLVAEGRGILYFNPACSLNREFIETFYPNVFSNVTFLLGPLPALVYYLDSNASNIDNLIIDPGDSLVAQEFVYRQLLSLSSVLKFNILTTSQIRTNPSENGKAYSTIERLNEKTLIPSGSYFQYSIWLRKVTEVSLYYNRCYADVFDCYREGNHYLQRYILTYGIEGNLLK